MIVKRGLFFISIIFGAIPYFSASGEDVSPSKFRDQSATSQKVYSKTKLSSDIERPLLRPVVLKKEDTTMNEQETSVPGSKKDQGLENILSLLKTEREKLKALEKEYKKLEKKMAGGDDTERYKVGVNNISKTALTSEDKDKTTDGIEITGTSSVILNENAVKNSSSDLPLNIINTDKKSVDGLDNDLNQRLVKVIKNVNLLDLAECFYKLGEYNNALQTYKLLTPDDISLDQYIWSQYQIANCYRNMKNFDTAFSEYQRFIDQFPGSDLIDQAKWYIDDVNWWKSWHGKNTLINNQLIVLTNSRESN